MKSDKAIARAHKRRTSRKFFTRVRQLVDDLEERHRKHYETAYVIATSCALIFEIDLFRKSLLRRTK